MKQLKRLIFIVLIGVFKLNAQNNTENFEKEFNKTEKSFRKFMIIVKQNQKPILS